MRKNLTLGLLLLVIVGATVLIFTACDDQVSWNEPVVRASSESPDGRYRCVVIERSPKRPDYSPYLYTITLRHTQTDSDLRGQPYTDDNDSAAYGDIDIRWSENLVEVSEGGPLYRNQIAIGKIAGEVQNWQSWAK
jgi:hypothetical protein